MRSMPQEESYVERESERSERVHKVKTGCSKEEKESRQSKRLGRNNEERT